MSAQGKYVISNMISRLAPSFGKTTRSESIVSKNNIYPGPGAYKQLTQFGSGKNQF